MTDAVIPFQPLKQMKKKKIVSCPSMENTIVVFKCLSYGPVGEKTDG